MTDTSQLGLAPHYPVLADDRKADFIALVVMRTSASGERSPVWSAGDAVAARELASGQLGMHDDVVALGPATAGGEAFPGAFPGSVDDLTVGDPSGGKLELIIRQQGPERTGCALVVDDDELTRSIYDDMLTGMGFDVRLAGSAAEATEVALESDPDVALIDVGLPDLNGYELARSLLGNRSFTGEVLLMSVDPGRADSTRLDAIGAAGFLENPTVPTDLARILRNLGIGRQSSNREVIHQTGPDEAEVAQVFIKFLGRPSLVSDGRVYPLPAGKAMVILAALAASCPAPVSSRQLSRMAWQGPSYSANAVYTAVSRLRSQLEDWGLEGVLSRGRNGYRLEVDPMNVDMVRFETEALRLLESPTATVAEVEETLRLWEGPPFGSAKVEGLQRWSARLVEARMRLMEFLAAKLLEDGAHDRCALLCRRILDDELWRESVWATLVVALYRSGQVHNALSTLQEAEKMLRTELGLEPGPHLQQLEYMVLTHDPELARWRPPNSRSAG